MLPKILKNFNLFVDGRGYAGRVDEITLPKLTIKTEEFQGAGMSAPVEIDLGMEKLEMDMTFSEYDPELFKLFGLTNGSEVAFTIRGALEGRQLSSMFADILKNSTLILGNRQKKPHSSVPLRVIITSLRLMVLS